MDSKRPVLIAAVSFVFLFPKSPPVRAEAIPSPEAKSTGMEQVPTWSRDDLNFFLHGSMSTEVVPETVLRAFMRTYATDLFPSQDLSHLGLLPDANFGWPIGFSRTKVKHLGDLSAVGINCASCHVTQIDFGDRSTRLLGATSHFDVEGFFGAVIVATFRTAELSNMKRFLAEYLRANDPEHTEAAVTLFKSKWQQQEKEISAAIAANPFGAKDVASGEMHALKEDDVVLIERRSKKARISPRSRIRCCSFFTTCAQPCTFPMNHPKKRRRLPDRGAMTPSDCCRPGY